MRRSHVNKGNSSRNFKRNISRTKAPNMTGAPQRGGWRL